MLRHPDTEHRDEHDANRVEVREVRDHDRQELGYGPGRQQVVDDERLVRARIDDAKADIGQQPRQDPDDEQQRDEQYRRVRKLVADSFYGSEHAGG